MKIMQWNIRGFYTNLPHLQRLLDVHQPNILCLQETWLEEKSPARVKNFHPLTIRKDRITNNRGGVSIHIRNNLPFRQIHLPNSDLEVCAVSILSDKSNLSICSLYIPPNYDNTKLVTELDKLKTHLPDPFIISLDANAHHYSWGSDNRDRRGKLIDSWLSNNDCVVLNNGQPTFLSPSGTHTHIDLTIAHTNSSQSFDWTVEDDTYNSDHFPILITNQIDSPPSVAVDGGKKWNIKSADWAGFLSDLDMSVEFLTPSHACGAIVHRINIAADKNIKKYSNLHCPNYSKHWWNEECSKAIEHKNKAYRQYKKNLGNLPLWIEYKKHKAIARNTILIAKKTSWRNFVSSMNWQTSSSVVWKRIKALRGTQNSRTITLRSQGQLLIDEAAVANVLVQQYANRSDGSSLRNIQQAWREEIESNIRTIPFNNTGNINTDFSIDELKKALHSCNSKSAGPDNIPYDIIKKFSDEHLHKLLDFLNYIWNTGLPQQWKESTIFPLLKKGKIATEPASYRPIAITNCLCKILEKMANKRLLHHLEKSNAISRCQSGFRAKHSTLDPLSRIEDSIRRALMQSDSCIAIFLDIEQAFDTVWHGGLLRKLQMMHVTGNLYNFIEQFLQNRKIAVRVNGTTSEYASIKAGVPQGSVISPTLFNIMINDIFNNIPEDIQYSIYADDGAMWINCSNMQSGVEKIQIAIDAVRSWSTRWGLTVSPNKTKAMIFTRKRTIGVPSLKYNNIPIEYVSRYRFLGVTLDRTLSWGPHISELRDRCQSDLRLLRVVSSNGWGADSTVLGRLYTALIRTKMDYASFLYATAADSHLIKLDRVQYGAIRTILGMLRCTRVNLLEAESGFLPLKYRRELLLFRYTSKVLTIDHHPVNRLLRSYYHYDFYQTNKHHLSFCGRATVLFQKINIEYKQILPIPILCKHSVTSNNIGASLSKYRKDAFNNSQWQSMFRDLVSGYPLHTKVFCDGSVQRDGTGFGVWSEGFTLSAKLSNYASILTAEMFAIYSAISFVQHKAGSFLILTNSLSSIEAIKHSQNATSSLATKINTILLNTPENKIVVEWVPSHMAIHGNEEADRLAGEAVKLPSTTINSIESGDADRAANKYLFQSWQEHWSSTQDPHLCLKPLVTHQPNLPPRRKDQITVTRLRVNTCLLTHAHFFTKSNKRVCNTCLCDISIKHILIDCPTYEPERRKLASRCRGLNVPLKIENILSSNSLVLNEIILFLRETDLQTSI